MSTTQAICLINQDSCARETGNPLCPKCGIDDRVAYPDPEVLEVALAGARARYREVHAQGLQGRLDEPGKLSEPTPAPCNGPNAVGQTFRDAPWAPEMVMLPSGKFLMGSPPYEPNRLDDEGPQHEVTIGYPFAMGKYPVTFSQWDDCFADGGTNHVPQDWGRGRGKRPVIDVSWNDAQCYVVWLNKKMGYGVGDPTKYRIPSEAEWEYACRAGTTGMYSTPDGLMNADRANYKSGGTFFGALKAGHKADKIMPVGKYPGNSWCLHDMHGNVLEWAQDSYEGSYRGAPQDGSAWETGSSRRVLRGGSWLSGPTGLRTANRWCYAPEIRVSYIGFRLARTLP